MAQQQEELVVEFWQDKTAVIRFNNYKLVLQELKTYFNDFKLGVQRVFQYKNVFNFRNKCFHWKSRYSKTASSGSTTFKCCWGNLTIDNSYNNKKYKAKNVVKNGIEVLINIENKNMLGKLFTIKELKNSCKINGLKKYSKLDKLQLISLLMTI